MKSKQRRVLFSAILFIVLSAFVLFALFSRGRLLAADAPVERPTLVIDAGHGGIDGGAVSEDGSKESEINLAIALRLDSIVRFCGQKTLMTRCDEIAKTDILEYSEHEDLKQRAELVNKTENAVLISIHQNYFPTAQPRGTQVLYSSYSGSETLAENIQDLILSKLDPENRRLAAPAPSSLYLTANTRCPAVIVECGFMSNNFEVLKLKDPSYQNAMELEIAAAYFEFTSGNRSI